MPPITVAVLTAAAFMGLAPIAVAQTGDTEPETLVTTDECTVVPLEEGAPLPPADAAPDSLSDALDPCDGVLAPEGVGDEDLTVLPPEGGETPVIEPEELPPQPPQAE